MTWDATSELLRGSLSRHRSLLLRGLNVTTTAAATTIAAAIAAAMATTVATAVATAAPVAAAMAAAVAATIAAIAAAATAAMTKGQSLAIAAYQGNTNQREKQRETENNDTIHPQFLQITYRYR